MKLRIIINISILTLTIMLNSCRKNIEKTINPEDKHNNLKNDTTFNKLKLRDSLEEIKVSSLDISVKKIKSQIHEVTTSFLLKSNTIIYVKKSKNLFGVYNMFNEKSRPIGKMIVYDSLNPYEFDKETDEFIEINLWKDGINILDNEIHIGSSKKDLINKLGENYTIFKDKILVYKNNTNNIGFFRFNNNKIDRIKIGKYRDSIDYEKILKYIWW